jgi:nucleotide-binding universal stress UspA family protein
MSDVFVSAADRIEELLQEEAKQAEARLGRLASQLTATGLKVTTAVKRGDPRTMLIDAATEAGSDLLVVGSHGSGALKQVLLGSVALHAATNAPCNVLIVRRR